VLLATSNAISFNNWIVNLITIYTVYHYLCSIGTKQLKWYLGLATNYGISIPILHVVTTKIYELALSGYVQRQNNVQTLTL